MKYNYDKYKNWIDIWYETQNGSINGKCMDATHAMSKQYPELVRVFGQVRTAKGIEHNHWWLETALGAIVDPTSKQFPLCTYLPRFRYLPDGDIIDEWVGKSIRGIIG